MRDKPRCYMARPGEGLTPMADPGSPATRLPVPEEPNPMSLWSLALDSDSPMTRSAARAVFGFHVDVDTGPIRPNAIRTVELRRYVVAEVPGYRAAFVVYAETAAEARKASEHSADLLVYTSPKPSRTSDPG
mgnify:FL=1